MTDPLTCPHETTEPVYAVAHPNPVKVGDQATYANDGRPVARICTDCHTQLQAGWGCLDCDWVEIEDRRLCDPTTRVIHYLATPCKEHR